MTFWRGVQFVMSAIILLKLAYTIVVVVDGFVEESKPTRRK